MNMLFERKLAIPMEVKEMYPLTGDLNRVVEERTAALKAIFDGRSDQFLLIIGPCSADNEDSVLEYVNRLRLLAEKVRDRLFIVPRVYTNKPRTTGDGYKGMLHQPNPGEKPDMFKGIIAIRELHMRVLRETGMAAADEMLYPENYQYLDDMLGYVAVGARSVENQQHRLTASGIDVPVGMKNPTSGDFQVMLNAIQAAQHRHTFIYRGWEARSEGNPYAHAILRGYMNKHGQSMPNYHYEDLVLIDEFYRERALKNPAVVVDVNHSNSNKQYVEQIRIAREVMHSRRYNESLRRLIKGLMIESYLVDGAQEVGGCVFGQSITDPCLGWEKTERLVLDLAEMV